VLGEKKVSSTKMQVKRPKTTTANEQLLHLTAATQAKSYTTAGDKENKPRSGPFPIQSNFVKLSKFQT
jgi:hypothetical protein